jgi:hypothetical protein
VRGHSFHPVPWGWLLVSAVLLSVAAGPAAAVGSISGKLTAPEGYALTLEGARVNATDDKFHAYRATANEDGTYEITDLAPGKYSVVVVGRGLETAIVRDVEVKDDQAVTKDFTLETAKPFPIVYSPKPIPLTSDYYSADFADAPEMKFDEAWQWRNGNGALEAWQGPAEVSAKMKLKYSDQALHLAADINFKTPGVNISDRAGNQLWNGNSIEFFWQNDPLDLSRGEYDLDHNWQAVVTLADPVDWILYQRGQDTRPNQKVAGNILRKVRDDKTGELVRWDMPFSIFLQTGAKTGAVTAPALESLGALDIVINAADPDQPAEEAPLKSALSWSGFGDNWTNPSMLRPVRFTAQAP